MLIEYLASCGLVFVVTFGLAWPLAARMPFDAAEKVLAAVALSLVGVFLGGWSIYVLRAPLWACWSLPLAGLAGIFSNRQAAAAIWRDRDVRELLAAQALVTAWCAGWLAVIQSYSGGGWTGDWYEHWERARFFLEHQPRESLFLEHYVLPARPPLANVIEGVFLALTRVDFAHYQLVSTLLASLAFLPSALLARRWGGRRAMALLGVGFMLSPLVAQNATFAWTKLPAAFLVLTGVYFFLRAGEAGVSRTAAVICAACLAGGVLAHYSAGPYVAMLAAVWLGWVLKHRRDRRWPAATLLMGATGGALLALWIGWSISVYGARATFLANTSAEGWHQGNALATFALNLRDTIVPHFLRPMDRALLVQPSDWGWLRDWFFQCYQLNLPLAFGVVGWAAILRELARRAAKCSRREQAFWTVFVAGVVLLGIGVHSPRDQWGLVHICLQPLVLLGLAFLAARWLDLGRGWQIALLAGGAVDLFCGIVLQFALQNFAVGRWLGYGDSAAQIVPNYSASAGMNFLAKVVHRIAFFSDTLGWLVGVVPVLLAAVLALAIVRARASHAEQPA
jgi:hypothetical protein